MTRRGWILFALLGFVWGAPYLLIKVAVTEVDPWVVACGRTAIGATLLLPMVKRSSIAVAREVWPWLLVFSVVEVVGPWVLLSHAETHLPSSTTGLLVALTPLAATLLVSGLGIEQLGRWRGGGLLIGLLGVVCLVGFDLGTTDAPAVLAVLLSAVGYAIGPIVVQRKLSKVPPVTVAASALVIATLLYAPMVCREWPNSWTTRAASSIVLLGVVCTAVAFIMFFALIAEAGAARATVVTYLNPAVAVALGAAILNETLTVGMMLGFPLILLGSVLATRTVRPPAVAGLVPPPPQAVTARS